MFRSILKIVFVLAAAPLVAEEKPQVSPQPISKIFFGSCIKQDRPTPIFSTILQQQPELFIFLGDNIYADTTDMDVMRAKYAKLKADAGFAKLLKTVPTLATWDDHDYGANDAGANYIRRQESQRIFVDFWGDPKDSPRRRRPGVYRAYEFGPVGKRVQVLLLDTRYFRGPLKTGKRRVGGPYYPHEDPQVPMLGETQWKWLKEQLKRPADVRILASSIQCIPEAAGQETWSNLPRQRKRLFDLLAETKANGVLLISGDRHWSELTMLEDVVSYPLYELTSSSLNQPHGRGTPTVNRYRALPTTYHRENFGAILIDWKESGPQVRLRIQDIDGKVKFEQDVSLGR